MRRVTDMLKCTDCDELNAWDDTLTHTWLQWQCCACGQWIDWKPGEYDELHEEYKMTRKVGEPTQPGNCPDCPTPQACRDANFSHCVAGDKPTQPSNPFVTPRRIMPAENLMGFLKWQDDVDKRWDLKDEDGDLHSPVWYLEAWMSSQLAYAEALTVHHDDPDKDELHMQRLDDMQTEVDVYARYVNKLFGYSDE